MDKNLIISNIKGGFGNQLFQYATGLSIAIQNNAELKLDLSFYENPKYSQTWRLDSLNIPYKIATENEIQNLKNQSLPAPIYMRVLGKIGIHTQYRKKEHIYDSSGHKPAKAIINAKNPAYIQGWCVKDIYFSKHIELLRKLFTMKNYLSVKSQEILQQINSSESVSIHIRRGDYVNNDYFETLGIEYYNKAISIINSKMNNAKFFVFSNEINWAKENFGRKANFVFIDFNSEEESKFSTKGDIDDFYLMRKCKHNIIANSSFSWWPAWLNENPNKIVLYPSKWYGNKEAQDDYERNSFMPNDWIIV